MPSWFNKHYCPFSVTFAGGPRKDTTGKRNYSKPDYCLYCKNRYTSKISTHYLAVHSTEPKVIAIKELPTGSKERKRLLTLLQNEGNHLHNLEVRNVKSRENNLLKSTKNWNLLCRTCMHILLSYRPSKYLMMSKMVMIRDPINSIDWCRNGIMTVWFLNV